jgi:hypothetical protein
VHCNVTASSIIWLDAQSSWALSDFVFTVPLDSRVELSHLPLAVQHAPPELAAAAARGDAVVAASPAIDAWQLGLIGYAMMTGKPLFAPGMPADQVLAVLQQELPWEASEVRGARAAGGYSGPHVFNLSI